MLKPFTVIWTLLGLLTMTSNFAAASNSCTQVLGERKHVLSYSDLGSFDSNQLIGNQMTLKVQQVGQSQKSIEGLVINASLESNRSIVITYVNTKGERHFYEHYPFMKETERILNLSFTNGFHFEAKKAALELESFRRVKMDAYLLLPNSFPQINFHAFVQKKGTLEMLELKGELISRPDSIQVAMAQLEGKSVALRIKTSEGKTVEVASNDIVQLFVK